MAEEKKFPLWNEAHVRSAIKFFNYAKPQYRKKLAGMIKSRMKKYNISFDIVSNDNKLKKYYCKAKTIRSSRLAAPRLSARRCAARLE